MSDESKKEFEEPSKAELIAAMQLHVVRREYFENCNDSYLATLVRRDCDGAGNDLAQCAKDFIANVLEGKIKRKKGRGRRWDRDFDIGCKIYSLHKYGEITLTSNQYKSGAAAIVADEYGIEEATAIKTYQRIEKDIEMMKAISYEAWLGFAEDEPELFPFPPPLKPLK